jgi:starch phosphorylase
LAPLPLVEEAVRSGLKLDAALDSVRQRTVFTTHTPVAAGNESYSLAEVQGVLAGLPERLGTDWAHLQALGRTHPTDANEPLGITQTALKPAARPWRVAAQRDCARCGARCFQPQRRAGADQSRDQRRASTDAPVRALLDRHLARHDHADRRRGAWAVRRIPTQTWAVRRELRAGWSSSTRTRH